MSLFIVSLIILGSIKCFIGEDEQNKNTLNTNKEDATIFGNWSN